MRAVGFSFPTAVLRISYRPFQQKKVMQVVHNLSECEIPTVWNAYLRPVAVSGLKSLPTSVLRIEAS